MKRRHFLSTLGLGALAGANVGPMRAHAKRQPTLRDKVRARNAELIAGLFDFEDARKPPIAFEGIVVHHTATVAASVEGISRYHAKRFGDPLGIQYHFLIQNGKKRGLPTGTIQLGRWPHQEPSIHLFRPERAVESVTICLAGNYEERRPHPWMITSLVSLSQALIDHYGIALEHVDTHRGIDGRLTQCPGKHFDLKRFRRRLRAPEPVASEPAPAAIQPTPATESPPQ